LHSWDDRDSGRGSAWLERLVRDQEVGGSNPLAPTTLSLVASIDYAAFAAAGFWTIFGTFGTTEGNSNPNPHRSAHFLRNVEVAHVPPRVAQPILVQALGAVRVIPQVRVPKTPECVVASYVRHRDRSPRSRAKEESRFAPANELFEQSGNRRVKIDLPVGIRGFEPLFDLPSSGWSSPAAASAKPGAKPGAPLNKLESKGKVVFEAHGCAGCHGTGGVGGTAAAPALAGTGKHLTPALLTTILKHLTVLMQQGGMPPVSVNSGELKRLVAYVSAISASKGNPN
jgi:mono/diheme cytochrome c family protein